MRNIFEIVECPRCGADIQIDCEYDQLPNVLVRCEDCDTLVTVEFEVALYVESVTETNDSVYDDIDDNVF